MPGTRRAGKAKSMQEPQAAGAAVAPQAPVSALYLSERRRGRRQGLALGAVLLVVFAFSLCFGVDQVELYSPAEVLRCYAWQLQMLFSSVTDPAFAMPTNTQILAAEPHFYQVMSRLGVSVATAVCGALLALAGSVYQLAFRNPVAAPTMLGASNGVRLGLLVLVLQFDTGALYLTARSYLYGLVAAVVLLALVFGLAKLVAPASRRRSLNIVDLLLVGTIVSSLAGAVINYVQDYVFTQSQYDVYQQMSEALTVNTEPAVWAMLAVTAVVCVVPLVLFRFRANVLSMEDKDAAMLGVSAGPLRLVAIALSTLMMVVAQLLVGTVSMVCLVVPHVSRMLFGANFARQLPANALIGAILLVACRIVCSAIPFVGYGLPLGTVVSLVVMPLFVWVVALQQSKWVVE